MYIIAKLIDRILFLHRMGVSSSFVRKGYAYTITDKQNVQSHLPVQWRHSGCVISTYRYYKFQSTAEKKPFQTSGGSEVIVEYFEGLTDKPEGVRYFGWILLLYIINKMMRELSTLLFLVLIVLFIIATEARRFRKGHQQWEIEDTTDPTFNFWNNFAGWYDRVRWHFTAR